MSRLSEEELRRRRREQKRRVRARWRAEGLPPGDPRHGTAYGYDRGCREECCRKAAGAEVSEWMRREAARTLPERQAAARDPRHGSPSAYAYWRCRCELCRAGNAARGRAYAARRRAP